MNNDLISRSALKKKLKPCEADVCEFSCEGCHFRVVTAEDIDNAPTVEPEITEKQAITKIINSGWLVNHDKELRDKWERPKGVWHHSGECSVCHKRSYKTTPLGDIIGLDFTDFCKNCGADMRKGGAE